MRTNYPAVIVSAIVYWLLGALWYDVLFTKQWNSYISFTPAQIASFGPIWPYVVTLALNLLIAFVLAQVCVWRNANTAARGGAVGILLWIGIVGPITYTTYMYEMRPKGLFVMGTILGAWKKKAA